MSDVSVVVRSYNEEQHIGGLLRAIREQDLQPVEIVLVDSGSIDLTREIAAPFCDKLVEIDSHDFTFGFSLNVGIGKSEGGFIVIVSAHTLPTTPSWLSSLVRHLNDEGVCLIYGRQRGTEHSKFGEFRDFERTFGAEPRVLDSEFFANNANAAIRRDLWEQHAFDETVPGLEDIEWVKHWISRGYRAIYEPEAGVFHYHDEPWHQVRRRYYREAAAARQIGIKRRAHIPAEILRESRYLVTDLLAAGGKGMLPRRTSEIALFRYHKAVASVKGLWSGDLADAEARQDLLFDRSFRAVLVSGPRRAALSQVEMPRLKPGEVAIKVAFTGVCATDIEVFEGSLGYFRTGIASYPIVPGHEVAGRVAGVGTNVDHLRRGDPVVVECIQTCGRCESCARGRSVGCPERSELGVIGRNGGYAAYVVAPGRFVHRISSDTSLRAATLCEPLAVVLKGLRRLEGALTVGSARRCGVVGAGPIGHLCAQVLALEGHEVVGFDANPARRDALQELGIGVSHDLDRLGQFDVLVEATGDPHALDAILSNSAPGAWILLLGLPYAKREFHFEGIVSYDRGIIGSVGSGAADFEHAIQLLPRLALDRFFHTAFPLDRFSDAWRAAAERRSLKVMLEVDPLLETIESVR